MRNFADIRYTFFDSKRAPPQYKPESKPHERGKVVL